jgi:DNA (cytosine-5)-methyltransferase 1
MERLRMTLKLGSLFSGYGGLDMGVSMVLDVRTVWVSDIDKGACKILAHRYPDAPNLGDISAVDWSTVEPVDIIAGGSPCQDVSHAGKRAGMRANTRSGLWASMCDAIETIRPRFVVWENVRGVLSAAADSGVEPCPVCVGDGSGITLRALGRVLGDLAELGYDASWHGLRAVDIGAPHERFRIFVLAADTISTRLEGNRPVADGSEVADAGRDRPTPCAEVAADTDGAGFGGVGRLQPITRDPDRRSGADTAWGDYEPAVRGWEHALGRPAPAPTAPTTRGVMRLSAGFVEWMMGLPAGWVTDVPGITRNESLRALGNGVVPQQAAAALRLMLGERRAA